METMGKMQNLLGIMVCLSALGVAVDLAVAASIGSEWLRLVMIVPVVLSGVLILLCIQLHRMAKDMPFGRDDFRQELVHGLVVLCVQTGYCGLMLVGKVSPEVGGGAWGDIFAFLGYFCIFLLAYHFSQKKKVVDYNERKKEEG